MRICYAEEGDGDFVRWTSHLLRRFIQSGRVTLVAQQDKPDLMLAGVWRPHAFPEGLPVILVSNENWRLFPPHFPLDRYLAVIGVHPPTEPCAFIGYPYGAVHFDAPIERLYEARSRALATPRPKLFAFVVSNTMGEWGERRVELARRVGEVWPVDSAGAVANSTGYLAPRGLPFLSWLTQYKYMICLENSSAPGYITEKPFQAWLTGVIPIYDGGCADDLNPAAFIHAGREDVLERIRQLEADPAAYQAMRQAPLTDNPLSLTAFETEFEAKVLNR